MKLTINKEYLKRHLFVTVLMLGLGAWFAYDGLVTYPKMSAAELYTSIEKSAPPEDMTAEALDQFKAQKTQTQYGFALLSILAGAIVGTNLLKSYRFSFEYDDALNMVVNGKKYTKDDIAEVDRAQWKSKKIAVLKMKDGAKVTLDAWHHNGVLNLETLV